MRHIQYWNHNYKADLNNFRNCTWIFAHVNDFNQSRVMDLMLLRFQQLKKLFRLGLINLRKLFLKMSNFSKLQRLESRFHSVIVDGKKEF